ncbi:MAG: alpha/beta hydrolase, partial [Anaerolineae bacterium]|nr:alpha/beta hydrolase [Anaerolineae bacterium]
MTEKIFNYKDKPDTVSAQTFTLKTKDNITLHAQKWLPNGESKAMIIIVHGIAEHIGRYDHVAQVFVEAGFAVYGHDHRTHGKSEGEPRSYITPFTQAVDDLGLMVAHIRQENPTQKLFMYGHSMGSLISNLYILKHQDQFAGWISSGSPLTSDTTTSTLTIQFLTALSRIFPTLALVKLPPTDLSHDENIVQAYINDPLVNTQPTRIGMAREIIEQTKLVISQLNTLRLPILLLHGSDDKICPVSASKLIYEKAQHDDGHEYHT